MKKAFTLVELLVVIAIIGLIATLSVIALGNARAKSRDAKRVNDIKQAQTALELFFNDQGRYPTTAEWNTGSLYATGTYGTTTYIERIPTAPIGGSCSNDYSYAPNSTGDDYTINFYLESDTGSLDSGLNFAKAASLGKSDPSLVGWWDATTATSTTVIVDRTANNNNLVLYNGATVISDCRKTGESCMDFDGINDYGSVGPTLNPVADMGYGEQTVSVWINLRSAPASPASWASIYASHLGAGGGNKGNSIKVYIYGNLNFEVYGDDGVRNSYTLSSTYNLGFNTWKHLTVVFHRTFIELYTDGVKMTQTASFVNQGDVSQAISSTRYIASLYEGAWFLDAQLADFRIYNRSLAAPEIKAIYDSTK